MKKLLFIIFLIVILLSACIPTQSTPAINMTDVQNTAAAIIETRVVLTEEVLPTSTPSPVPMTPTLLPTQIPYILRITPDAIQVERWQEYQAALAKKIVSKLPVETVLCEWEILGQKEQEVYVWATCSADIYIASSPTVIYLETDGAIRNVEDVVPGSRWDADIQRLFPPDVQKAINSYGQITGPQEMLDHLKWRHSHWGEPPLIVLSVFPTTTPIP